jgi:hypothetical protein
MDNHSVLTAFILGLSGRLPTYSMEEPNVVLVDFNSNVMDEFVAGLDNHFQEAA